MISISKLLGNRCGFYFDIQYKVTISLHYLLSFYSPFFRDMLENSVASSSLQNPIPVDESCKDFGTMLLVITGQPYEALNRTIADWDHAVRLYRIAEKYQLDGHRRWFSEICCRKAAKRPIEALIMACDQPQFDFDLAKCAIAEGFPTIIVHKSFDPLNFLDSEIDQAGPAELNSLVVELLDASNMSLKFRLRLGFKGTVAYNHTFTGLKDGSLLPDWSLLANKFIGTMRKIERELRLDSSVSDSQVRR